MGRGNDHRDRRRRAGDQPDSFWGSSDYAPQPSFERPSRPMSPRPPMAASGPETEARVKWFNAEKGFGFVELTDGSGEAFLHIRPVEAAGYSALDPGTTLTVRVGQGQKGAQVTEVLNVDTSTAQPDQRGPRPGGPRGGGFDRGAPRAPSEPVSLDGPEAVATVKWYDAIKGFGFVSVEGEPKDLFVHRTALERAGLRQLAEGQQVRITIIEGRKGREVGAISVL